MIPLSLKFRMNKKRSDEPAPIAIHLRQSDKDTFDEKWFMWSRKMKAIDGKTHPRHEYFKYLLTLDKNK